MLHELQLSLFPNVSDLGFVKMLLLVQSNFLGYFFSQLMRKSTFLLKEWLPWDEISVETWIFVGTVSPVEFTVETGMFEQTIESSVPTVTAALSAP